MTHVQPASKKTTTRLNLKIVPSLRNHERPFQGYQGRLFRP